MKIKFNVGYNERRNKHYYAFANVLDELPEIGSTYDGETVTHIGKAFIDCEQPTESVYDYIIYAVDTRDEDGDEYTHYAAIRDDDA